MKFFKLAFLIVLLMPVFIGIGCSDNGNDSNNEIPANLVDTWWLNSATINGEPMDEISIYCHLEEAAEFLELTLNDDGTWDAKGYRVNMSLIGTETGTFTINGNLISILMTACDGTPITDPANREMTAQFSVNGDILTLTVTEDDAYMGEIIVIQIFHRD